MPFSTYQYANFVGAVMTTSNVTLYTVPASTQALIKDITISNANGSAVSCTLAMGGTTLFPGISIPPLQTVHWTGLRVLPAGATIVGSASVGASISISVDGQTGV